MSDDYFGYDNEERSGTSDGSANELARNAVERFLESEASDHAIGYDGRHRERPERAERERRVPRSSAPADSTGVWPLTTAPVYDDDDEFMTQLASIRRDRPRRDKEPNPHPNPAIRMDDEHHRTASEWSDSDADWADHEDESFQYRHRVEDHTLAAREARIKEPRPRGTVPTHRREPSRSDGGDGTNPLRYLLAFMFVGVLFLMAVLAFNNRNLRQDLYSYQTQIARIEDNTAALERAQLELTAYQELLAEYRAFGGQQDESTQLENPDPSNQDPEGDAYNNVENDVETNHSPPTDETPAYPTQPPQPEPQQVIHIVQPGDMLGRIARYHYGSSAQVYVNKIMAANNITDASRIQPGDELVIPPRA